MQIAAKQLPSRHRWTSRRSLYKNFRAFFFSVAPFSSNFQLGRVGCLVHRLRGLTARIPTMSNSEKVSIEKRDGSVSDHSVKDAKHLEHPSSNVNVKLANPLTGIPQDKLMADAAIFASTHGLGHLESEFQKGALVAQDPVAFESLSILSEEDKAILRRELTHRWSQPWELYYLVILCSLAAAVQGVCLFAPLFRVYLPNEQSQMDESVINGANLFFPNQFGLDQTIGRNQWLLGLVNSAPYVCFRFFIHSECVRLRQFLAMLRVHQLLAHCTS